MLHPGSGKLQLLMEEWLTTGGDWSQSRLYIKMTIQRRERQHGARVWYTKHQLIVKFGSEHLADEIISSKMADPTTRETQVKCHPDAPQSEAGHTERVVNFTIDAYIILYNTVYMIYCVCILY